MSQSQSAGPPRGEAPWGEGAGPPRGEAPWGEGVAADRTRHLNRWRRAGYRLLPGDSFSYLLHLRPAEWPIMVAHTAVGFLLATGLPPRAFAPGWGTALLGLFAWVVCLNGGTLAFNSAFDRDSGDIGYLNAPPPPPRYLGEVGFALMAGGLVIALALPTGFAIAYAICFLLSILYSAPPFRLKAVAGADWVINMWGFGTLTPFAGWASTGRPLETWAALLLLGFCPLFAALYPLTQLYQFEEDQARGDRTLALVFGMRRSLQIAIATALLAFALFGAASLLRPAGPGAALFLLPFLAWLGVLLPWYRHHERMSPHQHQRGMYAALRAWALTDIVALLVFAV